MKTIALWLMLCIGAGVLFAQKTEAPVEKPKKEYYKKGELMLGIGTSQGLGFNNIQNGNRLSRRLAYLRTGVYGGVFVANKLMVGAKLDYVYSRFRPISAGTIAPIVNGSMHQLSTSLFSRYYFTQGTFSPFAEVGAGVDHVFRTGDISSYNANFFTESRVGLSYRVSKRISLEGSVGLKNQFLPNNGVRHRFQTKFGINFHF